MRIKETAFFGGPILLAVALPTTQGYQGYFSSFCSLPTNVGHCDQQSRHTGPLFHAVAALLNAYGGVPNEDGVAVNNPNSPEVIQMVQDVIFP
jgi:hypothetical protein